MLSSGWATAQADETSDALPTQPTGLLVVSEDGHSFGLTDPRATLTMSSGQALTRDDGGLSRLIDREYVVTPDGSAGLLVPPPHHESPPPVSYLHSNDRTHLAWGRVGGARSYVVEVDGLIVGVTEERTFVVPAVFDVPVTVTAMRAPATRASEIVHQLDTTGYSEAGQDLAEQIIAELVLWPSTPDELRQVGAELLELEGGAGSDVEFDQLAASGASAAVAASGSSAIRSLPSSTRIRHTTFIPDVAVPAQPCRAEGFFLGDDRGFSATSGRFRTRGDIVFGWPGNSFQRHVTTTRWVRVLGGSITSRPRSLAGLSASFTSPSSTRRTFRINHDMANPFCWNPLPHRIVATYQGDVRRVGGFNGLSLWGTHDRAPNHEVYYTDSQSGWFAVRRWNRGAFACLTPSPCTRVSYSVTR